MGRHVLKGNPPIEIALRRSARARRLSLRVSSLDGRVTLTMPRYTSEAEALRFARDKEDWLRRNLGDLPGSEPVTIGAQIMVHGVLRDIVAGAGRSARLSDTGVSVPDAPGQGRRVQALLRAMARDRLAQACDHYAGALGRKVGSIRLRDTRSRWGSCSSNGDLMFSWRLIMAPPEVLDYVAAHEVAHLIEMNHSPAFWAVVAKLFPDHQPCRDWLRDNGALLHRYRFDD